MIRVRVDWHRKCARCGTVLVLDYFDELSASCACPWCGSRPEMVASNGADLREYLQKAVDEVESRANRSPQTA